MLLLEVGGFNLCQQKENFITYAKLFSARATSNISNINEDLNDPKPTAEDITCLKEKKNRKKIHARHLGPREKAKKTDLLTS